MDNLDKHNIESWCQKVLDFLDLTFPEQFVILWNYMELFFSLDVSPLFLQTREEISEQFEQLVKLVDFMEYSRYFQDLPYPSQGTQAMLTQRQRKFELFFNPSQAKSEERLEEQHRQGAAVQPYPVIT